MRWDVVGFVLGWTIRIVALPLAIVAAYSCYLAESEGYEFAARTYLLPLLIAAVVGQGLVSLSKGADTASRLREREAFASVALGWIPVVLVGALPYWLGGVFYGPFQFSDPGVGLSDVLLGAVHSWFESMSGFTTTGATVIDPSTSPLCQGVSDCIGSQPESLILWRAVSQWLGGMGVIMLGLLILSQALGGGMILLIGVFT